MSKEIHVHVFKKQIETPVLLGKYRVEDGKMRYVSTTGKDVLKQRKCKCGALETYDLERRAV